MSEVGRRGRFLAWFFAAASVLLYGLGLALLLPTFDRQAANVWAFPGYEMLIGGALVAVGLPVALRRPENPIGWAFLLAALLGGIQSVGSHYARATLFTTDHVDTFGTIGVWVEQWIWLPIVYLLTVFLFSYFPDGQLPSRRWRWVHAVALLACAVVALGISLMPRFGSGPDYPFANPIALAGADTILAAVQTVAMAAFVGTMFLALWALLARFRSSEGSRRRQLEWVLSACALVPFAFIFYVLFQSKASETLVVVSLISIPISSAIAIRRYRLYDIDVLISRTLVYVPLTGILAGLYAASVALFQRLFQALTGDKSDAAIVISALVLASVFTPARNALQGIVDRRFKPDSDPARRLMAFAAELSKTYFAVDPGRLAAALVTQVQQATDASAVSVALHCSGRDYAAQSGHAQGEPSVSIPVSGRDDVAGAVALWERRTGRPYTSTDIDAVSVAAAGVARALAGT